MLSYLARLWIILSVCDEWLNDSACVPVVNVEKAVHWSLLFLLICTEDIKHTTNGGEETTAPRPHSA